MTQKTIVIFRQDLRLRDNPALTQAAKRGEVVPIYIFDDTVPHAYQPGGASRWWLHHSLKALQASFAGHGVNLILRRGEPVKIISQLLSECGADAVYWNRCYESHAIETYKTLKSTMHDDGIEAKSFNASLLFEPWEITNQQGQPFKVFTPFWKHCQSRNLSQDMGDMALFTPTTSSCKSDVLDAWELLPHHPDWSGGLQETWQPGEAGALSRLADFLEIHLKHYPGLRDFPARAVTSGLSAHLHWGEIGSRQLWHAAKYQEMQEGNSPAVEKFLSEIGWREFSYHLLYHFPDLPKKPFNKKFEHFPWSGSEEQLQAWQRGRTGYPIVDAGMRELWHTGIMHNRVRMIVASFLTKDLHIAWQEGAAWFWDTLVDADLASNSASWQWVAGCGVDAAPYYRIFNPVLQGEKFDPQGDYVRRWVPELSRLPDAYIHAPWKAGKTILRDAAIELGRDYPHPMVDHAKAREVALQNYKQLSGVVQDTIA